MFRRIERRLVSTFLVILCLSAGLFAAAPAAPPGLDDYVARVMETFKVPGIGLAIVKDGQVVLAKGYGVRKLGAPEPADEHTLFGIGSNTKLFTTTALGMLVDQGKLQWDTPVTRILPWFALSNPYVTVELTVRDLLVHRSGLGLGAGDLLWWPASTYNRHQVADRLRYIPLATSFRSAYAYDNVLYLVAGEVVEALAGTAWEDFVSTRILQKVGMTDSNVRHSDAARSGNVAAPHAAVDGRVRPVVPFDSDNTNPAGGINASAADMAKWMLVQLSSGKLADGSTLISSKTARELTTLVTPMPTGAVPAEVAPLQPAFHGYALGIEVRDYRGHKLLAHTGGLPGYVSRVLMMPDANVGVAVLTNQESAAAFDSIALHILDHYLGATFDWLDGFKQVQARIDASVAEAERGASARRDPNAKPSLPLEKYAGMYRDAWYGDIAIVQENGRLVIRFSHTPSLVGDLEPWHHDTFVARWRDREIRADAFITFALRADGSIDQAKMEAVSPATDFSYDFQDLLLKPVPK